MHFHVPNFWAAHDDGIKEYGNSFKKFHSTFDVWPHGWFPKLFLTFVGWTIFYAEGIDVPISLVLQ